MDRFRHGNVLFAGDSAHGVSPFGARGANSGVQDAENLAWKLAMVLEGNASEGALLDTYASEREFAADENIRNSTRSTDFITPKSPVSRVFRDAVLKLSRQHPFARQLANSGRLSVPAVLRDSPLNPADGDRFEGAMVPGASCVDAPVLVAAQPAWLLQQLGQQFTGVLFCGEQGVDQATRAALDALNTGPIPLKLVVVTSGDLQAAVLASASISVSHSASVRVAHDADGHANARYDAKPGTFYLIRPDQHVCARWRQLDADAVTQALKRALSSKGRPEVWSLELGPLAQARGTVATTARHRQKIAGDRHDTEHATESHAPRRFLRSADRHASRSRRGAEPVGECATDSIARQPYWRSRRRYSKPCSMRATG